MSERFDNLSKAMAGPMPRRRALRLMGASLAAGAAAVVVRPFRGDAVGGCGVGEQTCGNFCCKKGTFCSTPSPGDECCCPKGSTPCGVRCCAAGVACYNSAQGVCGCRPGTTPCVARTTSQVRCCAAGVACTPNSTCPFASNNTVPATCS
jgi:hypothetical protein